MSIRVDGKTVTVCTQCLVIFFCHVHLGFPGLGGGGRGVEMLHIRLND